MDNRFETMREDILRYIGSGEYNLEKLNDIAKQILAMLDLDVVFAVTNANYKYQLDHTVVCTKDDMNIISGEYLQLSYDLYEIISSSYDENPFSEVPIEQLANSNIKSQLHYPVRNFGEYYGSVGFGTIGEHEWTSNEKDALEAFSMAVLLYLSVSHLATGPMRDKQIYDKATADDIISSYHVDFESGNSHAVKLAAPLEGVLNEWTSFNTMIAALEEHFVDPVYGKRMLETFDLDKLKSTLSPSNPSASMEIPYVTDGKAKWILCTVEAFTFNENGTPVQAVAISKDITKEVRKNALLANRHISEKEMFEVIMGINLDTKKYAIYNDNRPPEALQGEVEAYGDFDAVMKYTANSIADAEYSERVLELVSIENMKEKFDNGVAKLELDFPCHGNGSIFWIRLEIIPAQTYKEGNRQVVLYFSDVTKIKEQELQLEEAKHSLKKERERVVEKELQLTLDPLTGAYNRRGYEKFIKSIEGSDDSVGFLMIDVDHFKEINDAYGHETGDVALIKVVNLLKQTFRGEDKVFRIGGDEFAMILNGCKESAWDSIQGKLAAIHNSLKTTTKLKFAPTLSVGLVISDDGFSEEMPALADDALYITKRNGRAGISQVNLSGDLMHSWNDESATEAATASDFDIGKWRYECPSDASESPKLYFDEPARFILGIPDSLSPEECYKAWVAAVPEKHFKMLTDMQDKTAAVGQAEATHALDHPTLGKIRVRTRAKYHETNGKKEFAGHFVVLKDESIDLTHDDRQFIIEAMSNISFNTYYIELDTRSYTLLKGFNDAIDTSQKGIDTILDTFVREFVHPEYLDGALEFINLNTLQERLRDHSFLDYEYLSLSANGWCRSRWLPVKWNENGDITHVLLMSTSIDEAKQAELEQAKRTETMVKLQLRVGEMIAKTSVIQTGIIDKNSGDLRVWLNALFSGDGMPSNFELAKRFGLDEVHPNDRARFERDFSLRHIVETVEREGRCNMTFRMAENDGKIRTIMHHYETLDIDPTKLLMAIEEITDIVS